MPARLFFDLLLPLLSEIKFTSFPSSKLDLESELAVELLFSVSFGSEFVLIVLIVFAVFVVILVISNGVGFVVENVGKVGSSEGLNILLER